MKKLMAKKLAVSILVVLLAACTGAPIQAPVVERAPTPKKVEKGVKKPAEKDWRPESYIVKKGDTLYGIGLEYGFDYKEIAQANNIQPPYVIRVGQQLKLPKAADSSPSQPAVATATPAPSEPAVVVTPLKLDTISTTKPTGEPPTLSEPKATKEPYSEQALSAAKAAESLPKPSAPAVVPAAAEKPIAKTVEKVAEVAKPTDSKPAEAKPADSKPDSAEKSAPAGDDDVEWAWPATGKTVAGFNEAASAKGIDIAGNSGQPVLAAAPGKVVYSGQGLRGYGKLIIIKHNKTYLSAYAHNSQLLVKEGQEVTKGQKIAEMGNTDSDKVKLHFQIRRLGKPVDPAKYLPPAS